MEDFIWACVMIFILTRPILWKITGIILLIFLLCLVLGYFAAFIEILGIKTILSIVLSLLCLASAVLLLYKIRHLLFNYWQFLLKATYIVTSTMILWKLQTISQVSAITFSFGILLLFFYIVLHYYIKEAVIFYNQINKVPESDISNKDEQTDIVKPIHWKNEDKLCVIIQSLFPEYTVQREASPPWLSPQRFDAYIPEIALACEYQGEQHFTPVDYFGGKKALEISKLRDWRKYKKCEKNGITIVYFYYWEEITEYLVKQKLRKWIKE